MNTTEKREFIHKHLENLESNQVNDLYEKLVLLMKEELIEESEEDIRRGNVITHEALKEEVLNWRNTK